MQEEMSLSIAKKKNFSGTSCKNFQSCAFTALKESAKAIGRSGLAIGNSIKNNLIVYAIVGLCVMTISVVILLNWTFSLNSDFGTFNKPNSDRVRGVITDFFVGIIAVFLGFVSMIIFPKLEVAEISMLIFMFQEITNFLCDNALRGVHMRYHFETETTKVTESLILHDDKQTQIWKVHSSRKECKARNQMIPNGRILIAYDADVLDIGITRKWRRVEKVVFDSAPQKNKAKTDSRLHDYYEETMKPENSFWREKYLGYKEPQESKQEGNVVCFFKEIFATDVFRRADTNEPFQIDENSVVESNGNYYKPVQMDVQMTWDWRDIRVFFSDEHKETGHNGMTSLINSPASCNAYTVCAGQHGKVIASCESCNLTQTEPGDQRKMISVRFWIYPQSFHVNIKVPVNLLNFKDKDLRRLTYYSPRYKVVSTNAGVETRIIQLVPCDCFSIDAKDSDCQICTNGCGISPSHSCNPTTTTSTPTPTVIPQTQIPTNIPQTSIPTNPPQTNIPTNLPQTSIPTNVPQTNIPTNLPQTSIPTNVPQTDTSILENRTLLDSFPFETRSSSESDRQLQAQYPNYKEYCKFGTLTVPQLPLQHYRDTTKIKYSKDINSSVWLSEQTAETAQVSYNLEGYKWVPLNNQNSRPPESEGYKEIVCETLKNHIENGKTCFDHDEIQNIKTNCSSIWPSVLTPRHYIEARVNDKTYYYLPCVGDHTKVIMSNINHTLRFYISPDALGSSNLTTFKYFLQPDIVLKSAAVSLMTLFLLSSVERAVNKVFTAQSSSRYLPLVGLFVANILGSTPINMIRFGWAYTDDERSNYGQTRISTNFIILLFLLLSAFYLGVPEKKQVFPDKAKILMAMAGLTLLVVFDVVNSILVGTTQYCPRTINFANTEENANDDDLLKKRKSTARIITYVCIVIMLVIYLTPIVTQSYLLASKKPGFSKNMQAEDESLIRKMITKFMKKAKKVDVSPLSASPSKQVTKSVLPATKPVPSVTKSVPPATKSVSPATKPLPPATKPVSPAIKPLPPATKPVSPAIKPLPPAAKPLPPATKPLPPATKPLTPATKSVAPATKLIPPATKPLTPATKPVAPPTKPIAPPKPVAPATKPLTMTSKPSIKRSPASKTAPILKTLPVQTDSNSLKSQNSPTIKSKLLERAEDMLHAITYSRLIS